MLAYCLTLVTLRVLGLTKMSPFKKSPMFSLAHWELWVDGSQREGPRNREVGCRAQSSSNGPSSEDFSQFTKEVGRCQNGGLQAKPLTHSYHPRHKDNEEEKSIFLQHLQDKSQIPSMNKLVPQTLIKDKYEHILCLCPNNPLCPPTSGTWVFAAARMKKGERFWASKSPIWTSNSGTKCDLRLHQQKNTSWQEGGESPILPSTGAFPPWGRGC